MRFSILILDLAHLAQRASDGGLRSVSELIAHHNVTAIAACDCRDRGYARTDARLIADLADLGLKFDSWFHEAGESEDGSRPGSAIVSQLPIIGSAFRLLSRPATVDGGRSASIIGCRLGLSPQVTIDIYLADAGSGSDDTTRGAEGVLEFVNESPPLLAPEPPVAKRRRGRPPRATRQPKSEPVRLVFIACPLCEDSGSFPGSVFAQAGYLEFAGSRHAVYLRPALRPTEQIALGLQGSDPAAELLVFEV